MKKKRKNLAAFPIFFFVGFISAIIIGVYLDGVFEEYGLLLSTVFKIIIFLFSFYVQLIIHEAGHLVAGLLSGYSFGSFRIGSMMIVQENGRLRLKKQSIAGTGGQCLMIPPKPVDEKIPVILYNLGGVIMNLITLPICVFLIRFLIGKPLAYTVCVMMFLSGLIAAVTNGIPFKTGMINNDGFNALELRNNGESQRAFYCQFMILDKLRNGMRLRDMPSEYFPMPSEEGMKNSISASAGVFLENRLMDSGEFDEALTLINKLLYAESALIGLHKNLLISDKIVILLMKGEADKASKLYFDKNYQAFAKQMKNTINIIRTDYAAALFLSNDEKKQREILLRFDKRAKTHPYAADVESERELILALDIAYSHKN